MTVAGVAGQTPAGGGVPVAVLEVEVVVAVDVDEGGSVVTTVVVDDDVGAAAPGRH